MRLTRWTCTNCGRPNRSRELAPEQAKPFMREPWCRECEDRLNFAERAALAVRREEP